MIRDRETLNVLLDNIARFVRERLVPNEEVVADTDEKVRVAAMNGVIQHYAFLSPAKRKAAWTPQRKKRLEPVLRDKAKLVATLAKRLWDEVGAK